MDNSLLCTANFMPYPNNTRLYSDVIAVYKGVSCEKV